MDRLQDHDSERLDLVWGAAAIASRLNLSKRQTFHLLETGKLPAKKIGKHWVSSRHALKNHFADLLTDRGHSDAA